MKKSNELSLGDAIRAFLKVNDLDEKLLETEMYARWEELAGRAINLKTSKLAFKDGVLTVFLTSSVLRNELSLRKSGLLEHINQRMAGKVKIRELRFR